MIDKPGIYDMPISKLCECGCGEQTSIATQSDSRTGQVKGAHYRFCRGHNMNGASSPQWKGGRIMTKGYVDVWMPTHADAKSRGYISEHRLIAASALGRYLPVEVIVHHHNEVKTDNRGRNLVICQDRAYHLLLHQRMRAYAACGHASWRSCRFCHQYDATENLYVHENYAHHRACAHKHWKASKVGP